MPGAAGPPVSARPHLLAAITVAPQRNARPSPAGEPGAIRSLTMRPQGKSRHERHSAGESRLGGESSAFTPSLQGWGHGQAGCMTRDGTSRNAKRAPIRRPLRFDSVGWRVGLDAQAGGGERGVEAESHQEERGDPVDGPFDVRERHDTHLFSSGSGEPRGSGAVRLDKGFVASSEHCIDQRFRLIAMQIRTGPSARRGAKNKGPARGPFVGSTVRSRRGPRRPGPQWPGPP
jgi:hypothetical protein